LVHDKTQGSGIRRNLGLNYTATLEENISRRGAEDNAIKEGFTLRPIVSADPRYLPFWA
jgi:hypothetical protein